MSKVCDCEGSDKAYLIINPGSVNRQEILSLNPPICREPKEIGLSINGTIFPVQEELDPVSPYTLIPQDGGLEVDWGGGDIDILDGETATVEAVNNWVVVSRGGWSDNHGGNGCSSGVKISDLVIFRPFLYALSGFTNQLGSVVVPDKFQFLSVRSNDAVLASASAGDTMGCTKFHLGGCHFGQVFVNGAGPFNSGFLKVEYLFEGYRVTSNTGDVSERETSTPPDVALVTEGCILTINHLSGSTFNYGQVPCNSQIFPVSGLEISDLSGVLFSFVPYNGEPFEINCEERQCPPETCCNPCEGSALNCCYDENGRLIDSFIRRT